MGAAHVDALRRVPGVNVIAIASIDFPRAKELAAQFGITNVFEDWKALLDRKDVHAGEPEGRRRLRGEMIRAERRMLVRLRNEGAISDDVLRELEQELDLEAVRVGAGEER